MDIPCKRFAHKYRQLSGVTTEWTSSVQCPYRRYKQITGRSFARPSSVAMHKVRERLTRTSCIATEEGLCGRNVLHSLRVHSCASMLNNICSESMSAARMSLYSTVDYWLFLPQCLIYRGKSGDCLHMVSPNSQSKCNHQKSLTRVNARKKFNMIEGCQQTLSM